MFGTYKNYMYDVLHTFDHDEKNSAYFVLKHFKPRIYCSTNTVLILSDTGNS